MKFHIVGGGLAGCLVARELAERGQESVIYERFDLGGLIRSDHMNGVLYEPHGSHIFHTDYDKAWAIADRYLDFHRYEHSVPILAGGRQFNWPLQLDELVEAQHDVRPYIQADILAGDLDFETWCLSRMSMDVYELFIRPYTEKQWGRPASELPSSFAPNRVQIRDDGDRRLFKDKYQGWPSHPNGYTALIDGLVHNPKITITHGDVRWPDLRDLMQDDDNYLVVTAPLDEFCNEAGGKLEWRGLRFGHCYVPDVQFATQAMVVNFPGPEFPWIRTHETKHASGQQCEGTVVSYEYTGAPSRYYPIETDKNRERQVWYESSLKLWTQGRVSFAGRLGTYRYMDMDEVIVDAISCAERIAATCDISYDPDGWWMR